MNIGDDDHNEPPCAERAVRQSRLTKAKLVSKRLGLVDITVQNISARGIGARGPDGLQNGDKVILRLGRLPDLPGTVRWVRNGRFGLAVETSCSLVELLAAERTEFPTNDEVRTFEAVRQMHAQARRPALSRAVGNTGASQYWMR